MSVWMSTFFAGLIWTAIVWFSAPAVGMFTKLKGKTLMFGFYFLANFFALWLTARLAPVSGFGSVSFIWLVLLALVGNVAQYALWKVGGFKKTIK